MLRHSRFRIACSYRIARGVIVLVLAALGGCGIKGPLQPPPAKPAAATVPAPPATAPSPSPAPPTGAPPTSEVPGRKP